MPAGKEIRNQIASIQNTQKITSAMKMVAASKMKKTYQRMDASRPYADKLSKIISHLAYAHSEFKHPYTQSNDANKVGYIIVASDRGLCGGLNTNLFRALLKNFEQEKQQNDIELCAFGKKAVAFFKNIKGLHMASVLTNVGDAPNVDDMIGAIKVMLDQFDNGEINRLFIAHNEYINTISQKPLIKQLLPITPPPLDNMDHHWDYIYEPDAKTVLTDLLIRYIESIVYQGVVENIACEQAARMVAMQSATDNAGEIVKNLQLVYNKARQAAITQEISEIVGGAAAI